MQHDTLTRLMELEQIKVSAGLSQSSPHLRMRFGDVAVKLGYVSQREVEAALAVQRLDDNRGRPHRLIGQILVDLYCMTHTQVHEVLTQLVSFARETRARGPLGSNEQPLVA